MSVLASTVMDRAAALLNDPDKTLYSYSRQLPFLKLAMGKLELALQSNNALVLRDTSSVINVDAGTDFVVQPSDLLSVLDLKERARGSSNPWVSVEEVPQIPELASQSEKILFWKWEEDVIKINPPSTNREVKLHYWRSSAEINSENSLIPIKNSADYLAHKTASFCAKFIGENPTRAIDLELEAERSLQFILNIRTKERQGLPARPRPYGGMRRFSL